MHLVPKPVAQIKQEICSKLSSNEQREIFNEQFKIRRNIFWKEWAVDSQTIDSQLMTEGAQLLGSVSNLRDAGTTTDEKNSWRIGAGANRKRNSPAYRSQSGKLLPPLTPISRPLVNSNTALKSVHSGLELEIEQLRFLNRKDKEKRDLLKRTSGLNQLFSVSRSFITKKNIDQKLDAFLQTGIEDVTQHFSNTLQLGKGYIQDLASCRIEGRESELMNVLNK
jgi:hypothetical protein